MRSKEAYFFIAPAMLIFLVFLFYPMGKIFYFSFYDYNLLTSPQFIGFENYLRLFSDLKFLACLGNSFLFILVSPVLIILSLLLALAVRDGGRSAKFFRLGFFLPVITPIVIAGIIWRWIFSEDIGILNYLLSLLSFDPVPWLSEYPVNILSVMILTVWRGFGYYMMIFLAGLSLIPAELEEAAIIDGANRLQRVRSIIVPELMPSIIFILVISTTSAIKLFTEQYILLPGVPLDNKAVVSFLFYEAFEQFRFGYASAAGVILFFITLTISWMHIRLLEKGRD